MRKVLVSAGEASGDLYASELIRALASFRSDVEYFGVAGPRMRALGVRPVIDAEALGVVGLVEVVRHIPRIYGEFRKLIRAARVERPDLAILTDSPDFNLRVATRLKRLGVPVIYLIAPQVWAWRQGRTRRMSRDLDQLLCIFPFEPEWFAGRGVNAQYIGHPLPHVVRPALTKPEFLAKHRLDSSNPVVALLGGSRLGEVARHLPALLDAAARLHHESGAQCLLALPAGFQERAGPSFFREREAAKTIQVLEGETWDVLAHSDVAIAASGTVTVEAAILGTPMVTYYKVTGVSWFLGRMLVKVPFFSMVNLIAGKRIVPELMQDEATGERLAAEASQLLQNPAARESMQRELAAVTGALTTPEHPMDIAARIVNRFLNLGQK